MSGKRIVLHKSVIPLLWDVAAYDIHRGWNIPRDKADAIRQIVYRLERAVEDGDIEIMDSLEEIAAFRESS